LSHNKNFLHTFPTERLNFRRVLSSVGSVLLCTFFLLGCLNVDAKLSLNSQGLATGEYLVTLDKSVALLVGITSAKQWRDETVKNSDTPLPKDDISVTENSTSYIMKIKAKNYLLNDDSLKAEVLGDGRIKLVFTNKDATESTIGTISLTVTFPYEIAEMSSDFTKVNSRTATLNIPLSKLVIEAYVLTEAPKSVVSTTVARPKIKTSTIICMKGNLVKKVSGKNPKCPGGFKIGK